MPKPDQTPLLVGQFWRRWSDDLRVSIEQVDPARNSNGRVTYKGFRRSRKLIHDFRREFRCVIATGTERESSHPEEGE
jgi:hypothetical protein